MDPLQQLVCLDEHLLGRRSEHDGFALDDPHPRFCSRSQNHVFVGPLVAQLGNDIVAVALLLQDRQREVIGHRSDGGDPR